MVERTGNFRIRKQMIGFGNTRVVINWFVSFEPMLHAFNNIEREPAWDYYCEEEVIYIDTHRDQYGNQINSSPSWRRI